MGYFNPGFLRYYVDMPLLCACLISLNVVLIVLLVSGHGHGFLGVTELKPVDLATIGLTAATLVRVP